jgi:hypothetical protein
MAKANRKDAKVCKIKKTPSYTKFKIRGGKYLYTLKVTNKEQAEKLVKALPVGLTKKEV